MNQTAPSDPSPRQNTLKDVLFAPFGCLMVNPLVVLMIVIFIFLVGLWVYNSVNVNYFGLTDPQFTQINIQNAVAEYKNEEVRWRIEYEFPKDSTFSGLVRHISPIRMSSFALLTHDILVTTGDFADYKKVSTMVFDHKFFWDSGDKQPSGTINLLHAVPATDEVYRQMLSIRPGDHVSIQGREILKIDAYDIKFNNSKGTWTDAGCNSILVKQVFIER